MTCHPGTGGLGLCPVQVAAEAPSPIETASDPAVVWTVIIAACVSAVLLSLSRALPPAIEAWGKMRETIRRTRQRAEDARIVDLSSQVDHLAGRVYTLEQNRERHTAALIEHAAWDQTLIHAAIEAGVAVSKPPPLYPPPT